MRERLKIKVCGMRDPGNISRVAALGPDYMGFIFYEPSPRCCRGLDPAVVKALPRDIVAVAVTVDMDEPEIMVLAELYGFSAVQLHGLEPPELCGALRRRGLTVIKAVSVGEHGFSVDIGSYEGVVDMFVFDTATSSKGGSGIKFDRSVLRDMDIHTDYLLSGGIGPEDFNSIGSYDYPHLVGVDLNSRFETAPGVKDVEMLRMVVERNKVNN